MSGNQELKTIVQARLKTVNTLIEAKDWDCAALMMGQVLECALKAVVCKTLNLTQYPANTRNPHTDNFFMTHKFDQLLLASGMSDIFNLQNPIDKVFQNWSEFTKEYHSEWPTMRYIANNQFDEIKVKKLLDNLANDEKSILGIIKELNRW